MNKQETITEFINACYIVIKCQMCGEERYSDDLSDDDLAERVWKEGWRFQRADYLHGQFRLQPQVLCQHCKDNQR